MNAFSVGGVASDDKFKFYAIALGGAVVAIGWSFLKGRSNAIKKAEWAKLKGYKETRKRIDENDTIDNADDAREWLRNRNK